MSSEDSDTTSEPWYVHLAFKRTRRAEPSVTTDAYTVSAGAKSSRGWATRRLVSTARPRLISVTLTSARRVGLGDGPGSGERSPARQLTRTAVSPRQRRARRGGGARRAFPPRGGCAATLSHTGLGGAR